MGRVLTVWKYLLLVFIAAKRKKYATEAVMLQLQHQYLFSDCQAARLMWSRFVNTRGQVGCNVPTDLLREHLNRRFKNVFRNLGANVNPKATGELIANIACTALSVLTVAVAIKAITFTEFSSTLLSSPR